MNIKCWIFGHIFNHEISSRCKQCDKEYKDIKSSIRVHPYAPAPPPPRQSRLNESNGNDCQAADFICTSCNSSSSIVNRKEWAELARIGGPF